MEKELTKEEAERRAREVAQRMLTTPKPKTSHVQKRALLPTKPVARSLRNRRPHVSFHPREGPTRAKCP
jgi:hypothetical protein